MELKPRELLNQENLKLTSGVFLVESVETKNFGNGDVPGLNVVDTSDALGKYWFGLGRVMQNRLKTYNLKPEDLVGKKIRISVENVKFKKFGKKDVMVISEIID